MSTLLLIENGKNSTEKRHKRKAGLSTILLEPSTTQAKKRDALQRPRQSKNFFLPVYAAHLSGSAKSAVGKVATAGKTAAFNGCGAED